MKNYAIKRVITILAACLALPCILYSELVPFALITIPKAGSHLCIKALSYMTESPAVWHTYFPSSRYISPDKGFLYTHFCLSEQLEEHYGKLPQLKKIIAIRDLRDVAVSIVGQIKKAPWPGMTQEQRRSFKRLSFEEQLFFVLDYEYDVCAVAKTAPNSNQASFIRVVEQALQYASNPEHLVVRYEHLVGEEGGGSFLLQVAELRKMADFIGADIAERELYDIADKLYGNRHNPFEQGNLSHFRSTFSKGKIGVWKTAFNEQHKAVFKEKFGQALIDLGYEEGFDW